MFTGLIKEIGTVRSVKRTGTGLELRITSEKVSADAGPDDSVAVNGVCLTVTGKAQGEFTVQAVKETVLRSNTGLLQTGDHVNLEPALRASDRLGGHIVQGHVDGTGEVIRVTETGAGKEFHIRTDGRTSKYIVEKGSVCVDGISLTVAEADGNVFRVAVIPHTLKNTASGEWKQGTKLNIETDIIGRYIEKLLKNGGELTLDKLKEMGY